MWVAHIPVITARTGTDHATLGVLLLVLGGAAFVGMQVSGRLVDRFGSRVCAVGATVCLAAVILGPVLAGNTAALCVSLIGFGLFNGALDVSMNAQAVDAEQAYGRPIMSSFHGWFSIGGLAGSGVVAAALGARVAPVWTATAAAVVGFVVLAVVAGGLAPRDAVVAPATGETAKDARRGRWWQGVDVRRMAVMAAVAFCAMLAEGTAYDWSALHVVQTFGAPDAIGAIAFGCFSAAMTLARFTIDPIATKLGPVAVVRWGATLGVIGMAVALSAPIAPVAIVGWTVFGAGLAGLVPQLFTAAGNLTVRSSGRVISTVVGCGYVGMLAGPAVVGFASAHSSLRLGLVAAVVALAVAVMAAGVVRPRDVEVDGRDARRRATLEG